MQTIVYQDHGEPSQVLTCTETAEPTIPRGSLRVRMLASPINPSDLMTIRGGYSVTQALPATPGYEGIGRVESASGAGLLGRVLTGKVIAVPNSAGGNWCEYVHLPARRAIPLPSALDVDQGAMFFVNPTTAFVLTQRVLRLAKGETLLQTAANSALGRMIIRLGRVFGFRTLNVVRRDACHEELKRLGADRVFTFDDSTSSDDLAAWVQKETHGEGLTHAIDCVGGRLGTAILDCLGSSARIVTFGTLSGQPIQLESRRLMDRRASIEGFWLGSWMESRRLPEKIRVIRAVSRLIRQGVLSSEVDSRFLLAHICHAVEAAEAPDRTGKILVTMD